MKLYYLAAIVGLASTMHLKQKMLDENTDQLVGLGQKLGLDVTADMFSGQTPEDVTNAIIGAALESGKS